MRFRVGTARGSRPIARLGGWVTACAVVATAAIGPAGAETLNEALASAYLSNPTLLAARAELRRTDEQVPQALAGWRPRVEVATGGGVAASQGNNQRATLSSSSGAVYSVDLRVKQLIYNVETPASIRQAEEAVQAERAHLTAVEQDVLTHAAAAYADVLRAQSVLQLNEDHEREMARQLESIRRRLSAGELTRSDVAQAEASLAQATAQRTRAAADILSARAVYRAWVGHPPGALVEPGLPKNLPATEEEAAQGSAATPNVITANHAAKAAIHGVDVSRGLKLPQLLLQGEVGASSQSILALVSVPLYDGTLDPQIRGAKQLVEQRHLEAEAQQRTAREVAIGAWQNLVAAQAQIASYEAQVVAAQTAEEAVSHEQALGLRTVETLLSTRAQLLDARVSLTSARKDAFHAAIEVLASTGRLTARDLGLDVFQYDPEQHYNAVRGKWWGTDAEPR